MSRPRMTAGKRNVQQQKREKAQAKQERRASRRTAEAEQPLAPAEASEADLIEALAALHADAEAGRVSLQEFEERREHIRQQLELVEQAGQ